MNKIVDVITGLLIEDNAVDIRSFRDMLSRANRLGIEFRFEYAATVEQAIHLTRARHFDIVVLDLIQSQNHGIDTLTRVRSNIKNVPLVVLTNVDDMSHAVEVIRRGAQDYLLKEQLNHFMFVQTVLHAIERHKILREHQALAQEFKAANVRLEKQLLLDPLTGILNRRGLQEALSREIQRTHTDESELLALIFDLDNFKQVNDTLGHAVGDVVLREIASKLTPLVRLTDYVARIGGDEFLVLMPQTRMAEGARVATKIRRAISGSQVSVSMDSAFKITASFGLISVLQDTVSVDELLARTHRVLCESKKNGKNRVSFDRQGGRLEQEDDDDLSGIMDALKTGKEYHVLKQPIQRLSDRQSVGYEFLSRFSVPGLELPDDFFRVCMENNLLTLVDSQCLKNCILAGSQMPVQFRRHINLFPSTIIDIPVRNLIQFFEEGQNGHRGTYCIEISEQQIIGDPGYLIASVNEFKKAGILIAIDDVGFGRSCLESLILLEPDIVKIDKKWVMGISKTQWRQRSLKRLLKVTQVLGSEVIAEGIETREDLSILLDLGVEIGQGYLLGRPD